MAKMNFLPIIVTVFITFLQLCASASENETNLEYFIVQRLKNSQSKLTGRMVESPSPTNEPVGCYNEKEIIDVIKFNKSITHPKKPNWCNEDGVLIPPYLSTSAVQNTSAPYKIQVFPLQQFHAFRVVIESSNPNQIISEAIIVARDDHYKGTLGRFLEVHGVELICCSYFDKDVARYRSSIPKHSVVLYWIPYEVFDDFEGSFLFQATIVNNPGEYWTNITSRILQFQFQS